jgi:hypothetical protein
MLKIDRQKVRRNRLPIALLLIELTLAALVVFLFYRAIGLGFDFEGRAVSISPAFEPSLLFFLALSIALLAAVHLAIRKKAPALLAAQEAAPETIKARAREKLSAEPRAAALLLIQFLFAFAVVLTIAAWLDPSWELIPWSRVGIAPPLTTILNAVVAAVGLGFFYYLYSFTAWYRK